MLVLTDHTAISLLSGVILQQMGQHRGAGQVVDSNDFIAFSAKHLTESKTADPAKTINCNFHCHENNLLKFQSRYAETLPKIIVTVLNIFCKLFSPLFSRNLGYNYYCTSLFLYTLFFGLNKAQIFDFTLTFKGLHGMLCLRGSAYIYIVIFF